jgi:glycosyltransferase involved in cell wall biosynthesis
LIVPIGTYAASSNFHQPRDTTSVLERKRILLVVPQPFYEDRGTPIAIRQVLEVLSVLGEEVDLLTFPLGQDLSLPGLRIHRPSLGFRPKHVPIGFSLKKLLLDVALTVALLRRLDPALHKMVHAVEEAAFPAVVLGRWRGVPVIYDMHSSLPEQLIKTATFRPIWVQRALRVCERWLIRRADLVVCSAGLADLVLRADRAARVREWIFPGQIDVAAPDTVARLKRELELAPAARVILYTGNFASYQGVPLLLDAAPLVLARVPEAVFLLIGTTSDREFVLDGNAAEMVRAGTLKILGRVPRSALGSYLGVADVVVSPRTEGSNLPLKVFDYMAAARPIVATDLPAHRNVLSEETALLVPPTRAAISDAIVRLLREPQLAARLAAAARARLDDRYNEAAFRGLVADIYGVGAVGTVPKDWPPPAGSPG